VLIVWDSATFQLFTPTARLQTRSAGAHRLLRLKSIDIDPSDSNLVVSFRHTSSIVKIDCNTGTILWTLGGKEDPFALTSDTKPANEPPSGLMGSATRLSGGRLFCGW
jgi:hypothetical protein